MPTLLFALLIGGLVFTQVCFAFSHYRRWRYGRSKWGAGFSNWVRRFARGRQNHLLAIYSPILFFLPSTFIIDFIILCLNGNFEATHVSTYIIFGLASISSAIVALIVVLKLGRVQKEVDEVRNSFFDTITDASPTDNALILLAAPNPGQYKYPKKEKMSPEAQYTEDFNRYVNRLVKYHFNSADDNNLDNKNQMLIRIACLPWSTDSLTTDKDPDKCDVNDLKESMMGKFLKDYFEGSGGTDSELDGYFGYVVGFIKAIQKYAEKKIISIYWLTKLQYSNLPEMLVVLRSRRQAFFGQYDYYRFKFNILDVKEQTTAISDLFNKLLELYGNNKPLSWKKP